MLADHNDYQKRMCDFAEDSIAYVYGEMDEARKDEFSLHLENCSNCADDLKAFSSIHFSIQNWKISEFDVLSTPKIDISADVFESLKTKKSFSWFEFLQEKFSFSRALVPVGALAILLIGLGFGLFYLKSLDGKAALPKNNEEKIINDSATFSQDEVALMNDAGRDSKTISNPEKSEMQNSERLPVKKIDESDKNIVSREMKSSKISVNPKNYESAKNLQLISVNKPLKSAKNVVPKTNKKVPKLNSLPEEVEDDNLRLADLIDEIGSK